MFLIASRRRAQFVLQEAVHEPPQSSEPKLKNEDLTLIGYRQLLLAPDHKTGGGARLFLNHVSTGLI